MRRALGAIAVLWLAPCPTTAAGESTPSLEPGDRIRLTHACTPGDPGGSFCQTVGRLVSSRDGTVTLESAKTTRTHTLDATSRIEVSQGVRSRWRAGAAIGFVAGAAGTYALLNQGGSTNPCDSSANQDAIGPAACAGLAAVGGVAGAGLGALVGSFLKTERWREVRLDALRVGLDPRRPGVHVAVALSF